MICVFDISRSLLLGVLSGTDVQYTLFVMFIESMNY